MHYVEEIKHLLRNTNLKLVEIAEKVGVSSRTVQNINNGKTHAATNESYPIRFTGAKRAELKERLSTPNIKAVERPTVLSPQLLDYISMLSLLGADINCLLIFRESFDYQLESIFKRKLSDDEILSILTLRPTVPNHVRSILYAYDNPRVKFINMPFWIKSGFIQKGEEDIVYSLFK